MILELEHPTDAHSHCREYRWLVASGAPLETVVFNGFDSKHIGNTLV